METTDLTSPPANQADPPPPKPRVLFFRRKYPETLVPFVRAHYLEQARALSHSFDVVQINDDADYRALCDQHRPDMALFETGHAMDGYTRLRIENTSACPEIPKAAFFNADAFCRGRAAFLADLGRWDIDTFFSVSVSLPEYLPDVAERTFYWPNSVDTTTYRDYGEPKVVPIFLTGSTASYYPWRRRVFPLLARNYTTLATPHLGYSVATGHRMIFGEQYARTLNASQLVPSCGTVANEVVRKHFEIPACRSCLVTEATPGIEAAGFVDMKNCVFADEHDVLDKIDHLLRHPDELQAIVDAGHALAHARHSGEARDEPLQWLRLKRNLKPGQRIVHGGPFTPLTVVDEASGVTIRHLRSDPADRVFLREGDRLLWAGNYPEAEACYLKCLNSIVEMPMPEPALRLALCSLHRGKATAALDWILRPVHCVLDWNTAGEPDPVEWAYLLITLLCSGRVADARTRAEEFPTLTHPELDRARWLVRLVAGRGAPGAVPEAHAVATRASVQSLPQQDFEEWAGRVRLMLGACGQSRMASALDHALAAGR